MCSNSSEKFSVWLRNKIKERGITNRKLAKDIGICRNTVSNHINGKYKPQIKIIRLYSRYFKVEERFLYRMVKEEYGHL